jgi:hypothetical protein
MTVTVIATIGMGMGIAYTSLTQPSGSPARTTPRVVDGIPDNPPDINGDRTPL